MEAISPLSNFNMPTVKKGTALKVGSAKFVSNQDSKEHVRGFYLEYLVQSSLQTGNNEDQATEETETWNEGYEADPNWEEGGEMDPYWDEDGGAGLNELNQDDCEETNKVECEVAPQQSNIEDE
mgnify:CR=1 FL=1